MIAPLLSALAALLRWLLALWFDSAAYALIAYQNDGKITALG